MTFGQRIKQLRQQRGWTQEELGEDINVSKVSISGYESGNRSPDVQTLICLSEVFGVTTDYLLKGTGEPSMTFGMRLKELRLSRGITQEQLSFELDLHSQSVSNYERDYREPSPDSICLTL